MAFGPTQGGQDGGADIHPHCSLREAGSPSTRASPLNVDDSWGKPGEKPVNHRKTTISRAGLSPTQSARF